MSIATALWILVEGLDLDICLEMHAVALASVLPVLSGLYFGREEEGVSNLLL